MGTSLTDSKTVEVFLTWGSKTKQINQRYRARRDPDHDGLWVVVDRDRLFDLVDYDDQFYMRDWDEILLHGPSGKLLRFPSIETALEFIKLLELSDQTNRGIV